MELISGSQFANETFMSAAEKECVLHAWVRLLKNGCAWHDFTIALYEHLTLHCCFIAHYSRLGFYEYYFSTPGKQTFRLLDQFDPAKPGVSAEIGMAYWLNGPTASDLNRAMRDAGAPYIARLRQRFELQKKQSDLAVAAALAKTYDLVLAEDVDLHRPTQPNSDANACTLDDPLKQQILFPE